MADLYIKELEKKVTHYETVMSNCPQCKTALSTRESESTNEPASRQHRLSRSAQQPAAKGRAPAPTGPQERSAPVSTPRSSAPSAPSSKQLRPASRTEPAASDVQQYNPPSAGPDLTTRPHQIAEVPISGSRPPSKVSSGHPAADPVLSSAADSLGQTTATSQDQPLHGSFFGLDLAEGRRAHSGNLIQLDLPQYKKPRGRNMAGRPPGEAPRHAEWMRTANIMLEEVPSGRQWREKVAKLDSSIIAAVAMDTTPTPMKDLSPTRDVERKELIRIVRRFAERHSGGRINFEHFILVCLCNVLSSEGVPKSNVVETLQICISDTSKQNIDKYLRGAIWVNELMNDLFVTLWRYRAVDLIAIWNRSVATYGAMGGATKSREYFITELTQRKYFEGYQGMPNRRWDTIPWIVKKELGDEVSYASICKALGYSQAYHETTKNLHRSNPLSPSSDVALYPEEILLASRQVSEHESLDDTAGTDSQRSQSVASQRTKRIIPDRSAKQSRDPDTGEKRRAPNEVSSTGELLISSSLGESGPGTQSVKRPLPDSPTSAIQPDNTTRRRQQVSETPSRGETDSPSRSSGRKDSHRRRDRA